MAHASDIALIKRFEAAVKNYVLRGGRHPDERDDIISEYDEAKQAITARFNKLRDKVPVTPSVKPIVNRYIRAKKAAEQQRKLFGDKHHG